MEVLFRRYALVGGIALSAIFGIVIFFVESNDTRFIVALILSITLGLVSQLIDVRLAVSELREKLERAVPRLALEHKIMERCRDDDFLLGRHRTITRELEELAEGIYTVKGLPAVYLDDIRQIRKLNKGDQLRSSCPISTISPEEALEQIKDANYIRSMREHARASERGVDVRRLYLFRNETLLTKEILLHLREIPSSRNQVRVVFRNTMPPNANIDFLVFGNETVSMGHIDADSGICDGTKVSQRPSEVQEAIAHFDRVWDDDARELDSFP